MSTDKGYIKLYRDIRDHWVWSDPETFRAWVDVLMMVNHKDNKTVFDGKVITVKRGSKITSLRKLANRWGWSKDKTARFLDMLEAENMIRQTRDSKKTLINVINYGFYQDATPFRETVKRHRKDTERTLTRTQNGTNNNGKNVEDIKEIIEENLTDDELRAQGWTV